MDVEQFFECCHEIINLNVQRNAVQILKAVKSVN